MATTTKVKLVLLGDTAVGKTCIVQRYVNNDFTDDLNSTIGVSFLMKTVLLGERKVELEIWDTAGQETYRSILPLYYRGAAIVVLVYDITNKESLKQAKWWVRQVKQECDADVVIALVGNKYDLAEQGKRDVTDTEAAKYAESEGFLHIETSAKTNYNIDKLFELVAEKVKPGQGAASKKRRSDPLKDDAGGSKPSCC